jgi:hypothetical protein
MGQSDDSSKLNQNETTHLALQALRDIPLKSNPYLFTRILSAYELRSWRKERYWFFALGSLVTSFAFGLYLLGPFFQKTSSQSAIVEYKLDQPYVVKIDLQKMSSKKISRAEIEINGDCFGFYSVSDNGILEDSKLILDWAQISTRANLPIVIKGKKMGKGELVIHFYDENDQKVDSTMLPIQFGDRS